MEANIITLFKMLAVAGILVMCYSIYLYYRDKKRTSD